MATYTATDPDGLVHARETSQKMTHVVFAKKPDDHQFEARFVDSLNSARNLAHLLTFRSAVSVTRAVLHHEHALAGK